MSFIPKDVILIWPGTNAGIPAGWTRETALDGRYPKTTTSGINPNVTGGTATHSHSAAESHGHTMVSHSHNVTTNSIATDGNDSDTGGTELTTTHYHNPNVAGVNGGSLSSVAATYSSVSNDPPYYTVIYIKAQSGQPIPDGVISLWNEATPPEGFELCDGDNDTPDLRNKYLKGAATGQDGGDTGGSTQNIHPLTHTHVESPHYHDHTINEAGIVSGGGRRGSGTGNRAILIHHHRYYLNSNTAGTISEVELTTTETVEPEHIKVVAVQNKSGGTKGVVRGTIALWTGLLSRIPAGWRLCDGDNDTPDLMGKYFKVINTTGEIGSTGGSNTHTHASQSHSHTGGSHTHTWNSTSSNLRHDYINSGVNGVGGGLSVANKDRVHTSVGSIQSSTVSWNPANTSALSTSNEPEYLTVAPIMFKFAPAGAILLAFL